MIGRDNVRGLLIGCGVGDSLGMPVEGMNQHQIKQAYGRVTVLLHHPRYDIPAGNWTDDTQLTRVVLESLYKCSGFNIDDLAVRHMDEYTRRDGRGWGSATMTAVNRLVRDSAPQQSGKIGAAGTGTAMKAAPLGLYAYFTQGGLEWIKDVAVPFSIMTHRDVRAICGAGVLAMTAYIICNSMENNEFPDGEDLLGEAIAMAREMEARHGELSPHYIQESQDPDNIFSNKLVRVLEWLNGDGDEKDLVNITGCGFYVNESAPFCLGMFLKYGGDYKDALIRTVNAGGDADTNGAMVGSLAGLYSGVSGIPEDWSSKLEDYQGLLECADRFWDALNPD